MIKVIQVNKWMQRQRNITLQGITKALCLPFYTILTALGKPDVDYFSLDTEGSEFQILNTIPWEQVKIKV